MKKVLVLGASGFLGSHIVRQLVAEGYSVRIFVRPSSNTVMTDDLPVERYTGKVLDEQALCKVMGGCDWVFHSIVDTRAWLHDPAPLYRVNIDGLIASMNAALASGVSRFVFTSTYATIGRRADGLPSTEEEVFHWPGPAPHYVACRVRAEQLMLDYCRKRGLPGVACCVGNTYGAGDIQPTPHGKLLWDVSRGRMPFYWDGKGPVVNIRDAAAGMLLAAEKGRVGERYILGGENLGYRELFAFAARCGDRRPPRLRIPLAAMYGMARMVDLPAQWLGLENRFNRASIDCSALLPEVSSRKAMNELGWQFGPAEQAVVEAIAWYSKHL